MGECAGFAAGVCMIGFLLSFAFGILCGGIIGIEHNDEKWERKKRINGWREE